MRRIGGVVLVSLLIGTTATTQLSNRIITTIAGGGPDQVHISTAAIYTQSLFFDTTGNLWVPAGRVFRIDPAGIVSPRAGGGYPFFDGDGGLGAEAGLEAYGAALDGAGNLLIADPINRRIRRVIAATGLIETVAGTGVRTGSIDGEGGDPADDLGDGGPAASASVSYPLALAIDPAGNIAFSDENMHRIRSINAATGIITTIVGTGFEGFNGDDIDAALASLGRPAEIQYDVHGNLYIADTTNLRIRRVDAVTGLISTVAGNGTETGSIDGEGGDPADNLGDGGPATSATVSPRGIRLDAAGNQFIADAGNHRIRRVDASSGTITTVAGNGLPTGYIDGSGGDPEDDVTDGVAATGTTLQLPYSVAIDSGGNLFIADSNNGLIRRVDSATGIITAFSGDPSVIQGDGEVATRVHLITRNIAVSPGGDLFVGTGDSVRRVDGGTGRLSTVAGCVDSANCSFGIGGPATQFPLDVTGLAFGPGGDLYISNGFGNQVLRVDSATQTISAVAGNGFTGASGDGGPATQAAVGVPVAIAFDSAGNLYVAQNGGPYFLMDPLEVRVRRVDAATGLITTVAGGGPFDSVNGDGRPATMVWFASLGGLAVDAAGNVFISEDSFFRVRRVDATTGLISSIAGTGEYGYGGDGGPATAAILCQPQGLTVDADGGLLIADRCNNRIRRVDLSTGIISTVAGNGEAGFRGDGGPPTEARLAQPSAVASLPNGDIAIADSWNSRVRLITTEGAPPVADAGEDFSVACTSADGTTVILDGSASTGWAGAALSYAWTGLFPEGGGTVTGVNPMVTLPLGRSENTLVVSDGLLDSTPDTVEVIVTVTPRGLSAPLANLAPVGETPPLPPGGFKRGSTLPLKLQLMCGQERQTDQDVAAPTVVGLTRDGVSVPLSLVQVDRGSGDPAVLAFRSVSGGSWVFSLRTSALQRGTYAVTIEMPDGRRFVAGFVLS